ncbi:hypothetical protein D6833_06625 [Candidatus Parcubacteria bacterium]|nr:MAG: hypothetical protein D6833_06625 [Candidatus Parcubacteria bacterium]
MLKEEFASQQAQDGGEGNAEDDGGEKPPALDEELADAKKALQEFLETELEKLNEQERELVAELGGEDPAQQLRVLARLRKAGKIGQQAQAQARTTAPLTNGREAPKTWEDATRALAQRLRGRI